MVKSATTKLDYLDMLLFPLRGTSLFATLGLALLFTLAHYAGLFGLFLFIVTSFALMHYGFNIATSSAMGHHEAPPVSAEDFSLIQNLQPIQLLVLMGLLGGLINVISQHINPTIGTITLMLFTALLPAIFGTLAVTRNIVDALNPVLILRMISAVGKHYLLLVCWLVGSILVVTLLQQSIDSVFLATALSIYSFLLLFHASGRLMFTHREELGLNTLSPAELIAEEDERHFRETLSRRLDEAHQQSRLKPRQAAEALTQYCADAQLALDHTEWLFARTQSWDDATTALWFSRPLIARLFQEQRHETALAMVAWCVQQEPAFRPEKPETTWGLSQFALGNGQTKLAAILLHDFAKRFPDNPNATPALFAVGRIAMEKQNNRKLASAMLAQLLDRGIDADDPRMQALKRFANA